MIALCDELAAFHAGELVDLHAQAMRRHIGQCAQCQHELRQLILEETVTHPEGRPTRRALPSRGFTWRRPAPIAGAMLAVAAAAALLLSVTQSGKPNGTTVALADALEPTRSVEVRLVGADVYRPYDVQRAGRPRKEEIPLTMLADLERQKSGAELFAAHLLRDDLDSAGRALDQVPPGASRDSDRAALELAAGHPDAALGHAAAALAVAPRLGPALWNAALARQKLRLPLSAAALLDRVAALGEPGWAGEARTEAAHLRSSWTEQHDAWRRAKDAAEVLLRDRTPIALEVARRHPDITREALDEALRAARPEQAAALVPLASAVDEAHGTTWMAESARTAAAAPRGRADLAAAYARLLADKAADAQGWRGLARRAAAARFADLEVGALAHAAELDASAFAELDGRVRAAGDPWLRATTAVNWAWQLIYRERRFAAAELVLRQAVEACPGSRMPSRCARLDASLAVTLAAQGRHDLARDRLERAFLAAGAAEDLGMQAQLLHIASEVAVGRDPDAADPVALAAAFREERMLRTTDCRFDLFGLDYLAIAALDLNRRAEARAFSDQAEALLRDKCSSVGPRLNAALVRARLLQHEGTADEVAQLRDDVVELRKNPTAGEKAFADHIEGRVLIERDRAEGEKLLRRAIAASDAADDQGLVQPMRDLSFTVLALDAGRRSDFDGALRLMAEAQGRPAPTGCTLGVAGDDHLLVVARGARGNVAGRYSALAAGARVSPAAEIVPAPLREELVGCPVVDVYGLLPRDLVWRYRAPLEGRAEAELPPPAGTRLVVTGVEPPAWLGLPALRGPADERGAVVIRGAAATPRRVLAEMGQASFIEIHAHGLIDASEPSFASLALSPDPDGDYALTADRLRGARLPQHPLVLLAACHAGRTPRGDQRWGLADAFLSAGARSVVASTGPVPDSGLAESLAEVTAAVRGGSSAAEALHRLRVASPNSAWLNDIVVFE
jgi:hypothetical protein